MSTRQKCLQCDIEIDLTGRPFNYKMRKATKKCVQCKNFLQHQCPFCEKYITGQNYFSHLKQFCEMTSGMTPFTFSKRSFQMSFNDEPSKRDLEIAKIIGMGAPNFLMPVGTFRTRGKNKKQPKKIPKGPSKKLMERMEFNKRLKQSEKIPFLQPKPTKKIKYTIEEQEIPQSPMAFEEHAVESDFFSNQNLENINYQSPEIEAETKEIIDQFFNRMVKKPDPVSMNQVMEEAEKDYFFILLQQTTLFLQMNPHYSIDSSQNNLSDSADSKMDDEWESSTVYVMDE